ncbi:hypothetical protein [Methylobacterium nigriterrae]|uniref:hypothetical protein n=1 Tax=Methylobacterium nigriterrae TaxID=3127512 RepID=UPI003013A465
MTFEEALATHRGRFGELPPLIPATADRRLVALVEEAMRRGSPVTTEDVLAESPEVLAAWRAEPTQVLF